MTGKRHQRSEQSLTGAEVREWRQALRLSQARAAEALGVSRQALSQLELGYRSDSGAPTTVDRRTELACRYLLAEAKGDLGAEAGRRWLRAIGRRT